MKHTARDALRTFTVPRSDAGVRLVDFLAAGLAVSRRRAKQLLDARCVFVNGQRIWMAHHSLRAGDAIEVPAPATEGPPAAAPTPRILFEDKHYLVADKPAGIVSNGKASLESHLRTAPQHTGVQAVHRLDKQTSGCLLFARSTKAFDAAVDLFRNHAIYKAYHAILCGQVSGNLQKLDSPLDGHSAVTRTRLLDANRVASHVLVRIETGRTHQIRRHFAQVRHPVAGDTVYATGTVADPRYRAVARHMLHAAELRFMHPFSGQAVRVKAPLPADFRACLHSFGLS